MLFLRYAAILMGLVAAPADPPSTLDTLAWMAGGLMMTTVRVPKNAGRVPRATASSG